MLLSVLLASVTGIKKIDSGKEHKDVEITFLSTDSKKKQTGGMFICLCGNNADGHQYAQEALANGAIVIVTERALSLPAHAIQIQVSDTRLALAQISALAGIMEAESNIESLIVAKGFEECVAVISDGSVSIVVKSDGLKPAQISQINEIVYEQAGIKPVNVKIIER